MIVWVWVRMSPELVGPHNERSLVSTKGSASVHCLYSFDIYRYGVKQSAISDTIYSISTFEAIMLIKQYDRLLLVIDTMPHGIYVP
jgi:hypothetical protein